MFSAGREKDLRGAGGSCGAAGLWGSAALMKKTSSSVLGIFKLFLKAPWE